jgi:hypothetical protein
MWFVMSQRCVRLALVKKQERIAWPPEASTGIHNNRYLGDHPHWPQVQVPYQVLLLLVALLPQIPSRGSQAPKILQSDSTLQWSWGAWHRRCSRQVIGPSRPWVDTAQQQLHWQSLQTPRACSVLYFGGNMSSFQCKQDRAVLCIVVNY